jgi:hypothetical protein
MRWYGLDSSVVGQGPVEGCCEQHNKPWVPLNAGKF